MKKIGKYLIISLLMLLGLACVGVLYLFFLPGSSLFNITYISMNEYEKSEKYDSASISTIALNSYNYDVDIVKSTDSKISVTVYSNSFGFVLKNNSTTVLKEYKEGNSKLVFDVKEPHGFAINNSSYIQLSIPTNKNFDLELKNNSADTTLNIPDLKINNLTYSTRNGDFDYESGQINNKLNLSLGNSTFTLGKDVQTNTNSLDLKITTGKFDASQAILGDINVKANNHGVILLNECQIFEDKVKTAGGRVVANKVKYMDIETSDTNFNIKEITTFVDVFLTNSGSIKIETLNQPSTIKTKSGNISVTNAKGTVEATSTYGDIYIKFAEDAESYNVNKTSRNIIVNNHNGKVTAEGIENIVLTITGNGRANISMKNVYGTNTIYGHNGSVYVKIDKFAKFTLTTFGNKAPTRVHLLQIPEDHGYTDKDKRSTNVNLTGISTTDTMYVESTGTGPLTIIDTYFA